MNPIAACFLAILIAVVLGASRRGAALGMMAGVLYLTHGQHLDVFGFNLYAIRFLEAAGFVRVIARREFSFKNLTGIDRAFLWVYTFTAVVQVLRSGEGQAYMIAGALDAYLCYFTFRGLIRDLEDLQGVLRAFATLLVPFVLLLLLERVTHHNAFAFLGGGADWEWVREGKLRCQASFRHPSLMGALGAVFLPMYIGLAYTRSHRNLAWQGAGLCLVIIWASNSGGPKLAAIAGLMAWALWTVRLKMRMARWALAAGVLFLALAMKAPVWYFPVHFSGLTGGDAWHRAYLMDVSFEHLGEWWLAGMAIEDTKDWFPYVLTTVGGADITNQFVSFGLHAGLGAVALFVLLLVRAFRGLGKALQVARSGPQPNTEAERMLWGMGAMLVAHIATWGGITYFDQMYMVWFMHLAVVANVTKASEAVEATTEAPALVGGGEVDVGVPSRSAG